MGCRNVWRWDCGDGDLEMGSGRMWEWERRIGEGKLRWRVESGDNGVELGEGVEMEIERNIDSHEVF